MGGLSFGNGKVVYQPTWEVEELFDVFIPPCEQKFIAPYL